MEQQKLNIPAGLIRSLVCLTVGLSLTVCLILSVGVAYGRYSTTIAGDVGFAVQSEPKIYCMAPRDELGQGAELPDQWTPTGNTTFNQTVTICVSNSDENGAQTPDEDMSVRIRLYLPEGVSTESGATDPLGSLKITLRIEGEDAEYTTDGGKSLSTKTALAMQKNAGGWIYTFRDQTGNELVRTLEGGKVSDLVLTLTTDNASTQITGYELLVDQLHRTAQTVQAYNAEEAVS